jgi:hypothetical protein
MERSDFQLSWSKSHCPTHKKCGEVAFFIRLGFTTKKENDLPLIFFPVRYKFIIFAGN